MTDIKQLPARAARLFRLATTSSLRAERRRRKAYDHFFRIIEQGTVSMAVPEFGGSFEIDCRSHILKRLLVDGRYESNSADLARMWTDRSCDAIDVGANVGFFTVLMAGLLTPPNRVLSIEPTPGAFTHLQTNVLRNRCDRVVLFQGVATDRPGRFPMNVIEGMEEYSSLAKMVHPSTIGIRHRELEVPGETIDRLVDRWSLRPGFIKIDAEGCEAQVLSGCRRTLQEHQPVILCEAWPEQLLAEAGKSSFTVDGLLRECGYTVQRFDGEVLALPKSRV